MQLISGRNYSGTWRGMSPLDERPDLRSPLRFVVDVGEQRRRRLEVLHRPVVLASLAEQVGQVGVQRGNPVTVAEPGASFQRLLGGPQRLGRATTLVEQAGQVVEGGNGGAVARFLAGGVQA